MPLEAHVSAVGTIGLRESASREPGAGEVKLAVSHCGICGSDLHFFRGHMPLPKQCPGHEISASIAAVGAGVDGLREGDAVTVEPLVRCNECARCRAGEYHLCKRMEFFGNHYPGGMAQEMVVPAYCVHKLPDSVGLRLGALAEPLAVGVHAARLGGVGPESRVLVLGAGAVGLLTAAACRHLGAPFVAITARYQQQRERAESIGVDQVLDPDQYRSVAERPDVVIETVGGRATTVRDGVYAVDRGGHVIVTGLFDETPSFPPLVHLLKEVSIVGSMVYSVRGGRSDFSIAIEILGERSDTLSGLITHSFPLSEIQKAFKTAGDKKSGAVKVLIDAAAAG